MKKNNNTKNILITGNPGVGKTTLIQKIISKFNISAGGFYTSEVRDEKGKRWGFKIVSLDGKEDVMASVETISMNRIGKYRVDTDIIDSIGVKAMEDALAEKDFVVIDEIGRMELFSKRFQNIVMKVLDSPKFVLGTISLRRDSVYTKKIKERQDTKIIRLTGENLAEIETYLQRLLS